jgi:hypothetical protein
MVQKRYLRVCELFARVRRQPANVRQSILDQSCADDADLRREVEAMPAADADPLVDWNCDVVIECLDRQ